MSKFFERVSNESLDSRRMAKISEAAVLFRLALHGFDVSASVFDCAREDWVVHLPGSRLSARLQVKTARRGRYGNPVVSLRRSGDHTRYAAGDFDFIVGYDLRLDTAFVFSEAEVSKLRCAVSANDHAAERWDKIIDFLTGCSSA